VLAKTFERLDPYRRWSYGSPLLFWMIHGCLTWLSKMGGCERRQSACHGVSGRSSTR
jgi:hypothetical protein